MQVRRAQVSPASKAGSGRQFHHVTPRLQPDIDGRANCVGARITDTRNPVLSRGRLLDERPEFPCSTAARL
jgi:hypothetical protein